MNIDVKLELESYCEYLQKSLQNPLIYGNEYTQRRQLGEYNNLRVMNGLPMVYSITEEGLVETLSTLGSGGKSMGEGILKIGTALVKGLGVIKDKLVDATANADNINIKAQVVLNRAKQNGVMVEGEVKINSGNLQFDNRVSFEDIVDGLKSIKTHLSGFISWYRQYYQDTLVGKTDLDRGFTQFKISGDMLISFSDTSDHEEQNLKLNFNKASNRLKASNKVNPLTLHEISEIVSIVHEVATIVRSAHLDKTVDKIKDYINRVKDRKEITGTVYHAMQQVKNNVLVSIIDHILDSCMSALKYCEQSTY